MNHSASSLPTDTPQCCAPCLLSHLISVQLCATPWTVACQAPLSMGFPRQEYWSGLSYTPPGDHPYSGIELASHMSLALAGSFFTIAPPGKHPNHPLSQGSTRGKASDQSVLHYSTGAGRGAGVSVPHAGTWAKHIQSEFFSCVFQTGVGRAVSWEDWKLGSCVCCWLRPWHVVSILTEGRKKWMNRDAVIGTLVSLTPSSLGMNFPYRNLIFSFTGDVHLLIIQTFSHMVKSG